MYNNLNLRFTLTDRTNKFIKIAGYEASVFHQQKPFRCTQRGEEGGRECIRGPHRYFFSLINEIR